MGRKVGQKMAQKMGYPLWMAPNSNLILNVRGGKRSRKKGTWFFQKVYLLPAKLLADCKSCQHDFGRLQENLPPIDLEKKYAPNQQGRGNKQGYGAPSSPNISRL